MADARCNQISGGAGRALGSVALRPSTEETFGVGGSPYILGHSEHELERLARQAKLVGPVTRALLVEAGVGPGMRVLDVGTGRGDVALIAAELVGEEGLVVGVDLAPAAVAVARERVALGNVSFREGDPAALDYNQPFDAVVGRYVLQFMPDPSATLRRLAANVVPGGVVAFHEIDWTGYRSFPVVELWDRCCRLVVEAVAAGGMETQMGAKLPMVFAAAGFEPPMVRMSTVVASGGTRSDDAVSRLVGLVTTLRIGDLEPDALEQQLRAEIAARNSFVQSSSDVTAWSRL
jgi:SAM-dependent methyltransferase